MKAAAPVGRAAVAEPPLVAAIVAAAIRRRIRRTLYPPSARTARDVLRIRPLAASARTATWAPLTPRSESAVSNPRFATVAPGRRLSAPLPLSSCHLATSVAPFQLT